jgi:hypothetical protein
MRRTLLPPKPRPPHPPHPQALEDTIVPHTDMVEPPAELLMPLLPYQKQFLSWAIKQVRRGPGGGETPRATAPC